VRSHRLCLASSPFSMQPRYRSFITVNVIAIITVLVIVIIVVISIFYINLI
jgi:hypothetical protein